MIETFCTYDRRDEMLVAYLYDDISAEVRAAFERHLIACGVCRAELDALGGVRTELGAWAPPERPGRFVLQSGPQPVSRTSGALAVARELPAWAQLAAAMLVLGVSAGIANVNVSHGQDGWSVRTGWMRQAPVAPVAAAVTREDVAAVEQRLHAEVASLNAALVKVTAAGPSRVQITARREDANGDELIQRLRGLIREGEQRQQRELALRLADVVRDVQLQRQADLIKIDRTLGLVQNTTGMAIRDQQQLLNNLAVRVSSQR